MNIRLRRLEIKDEQYINEWMSNPAITRYFRFANAPLDAKQIHEFVRNSYSPLNKHYAIVNEMDEYLGTVSLKNINAIPNAAEYAIVLRSSVHGLGVSTVATDLVLHVAFDELRLNLVYLNVLKTNVNAFHFYERFGFTLDDDYRLIREPSELSKKLKYYSIRKTDFYAKQCRILELNEKGDKRGKLVVLENRRDIPFEIRRVFYMYDTRDDSERGCHANRRSEFVLLAIHGSVKVRIDDGMQKKTYVLDDPAKGLYLPRMIWKEMFDFSADCVLLVLSSELYDPEEYLRDYNQYIKEREELF